MIPDDIKAELLQDPARLVNTRWVFHEVNFTDRHGNRHYCEVIEVREKHARLVTLYSEPNRHWWVPIGDLMVTFAAFRYIGRRQDLLSIRRHGYVWTMQDLSWDGATEEQVRQHRREWGGIWQIEMIVNDVVWMFSRANRNENASLGTDFFTRYRAATADEIRATRGPMGSVLAEQPLPDDPPVPAPGEPEMVRYPAALTLAIDPYADGRAPAQEGPPPRSAWEHLPRTRASLPHDAAGPLPDVRAGRAPVSPPALPRDPGAHLEPTNCGVLLQMRDVPGEL